ncbi:unnamed protein product [Ilex paraguariensis]|uniref:Uncharacterized protein n=1 Tax=Ilex paraguariensis TaxID=185542 RepID=A0ABC8R2B5_9AQUA
MAERNPVNIGEVPLVLLGKTPWASSSEVPWALYGERVEASSSEADRGASMTELVLLGVGQGSTSARVALLGTGRGQASTQAAPVNTRCDQASAQAWLGTRCSQVSMQATHGDRSWARRQELGTEPWSMVMELWRGVRWEMLVFLVATVLVKRRMVWFVQVEMFLFAFTTTNIEER